MRRASSASRADPQPSRGLGDFTPGPPTVRPSLPSPFQDSDRPNGARGSGDADLRRAGLARPRSRASSCAEGGLRRAISSGFRRIWVGWGGRIRTCEWRNQNPLPYHLATPQQRCALSSASRTGDPYSRFARHGQPEGSRGRAPMQRSMRGAVTTSRPISGAGAIGKDGNALFHDANFRAVFRDIPEAGRRIYGLVHTKTANRHLLGRGRVAIQRLAVTECSAVW